MDPSQVELAGTGFAVLDRVYAKRERPFEALGGSCGNVLVSLAMLQRSVVPLLALGDDAVGNSLVGEFVRAGADTRYISRRYGISSPVLAQWLDPDVGQHSFSFICPDTDKRYCSVDELEVDGARPVLSACAVFYTDRLNSSTFRAMQTAAQSGSVVFFEPSAIEDEELFDRAIALSSIVKFSSERLSDRISGRKLRGGAIAVITHGGAGLEVRQDDERAWCAAIKAAVVRDTCGSGDMVSVGIIDWMLTHHRRGTTQPSLCDFLSGVVAGQRLAAVNCAYAGARGIFLNHGASCARSILDGCAGEIAIQQDLGRCRQPAWLGADCGHKIEMTVDLRISAKTRPTKQTGLRPIALVA
jgi:fructokinase